MMQWMRALRLSAVYSTMTFVILSGGLAFANESYTLRAASVLVEQYETVFYSNVRLLPNSSNHAPLAEETVDSLSWPFFNLTAGLDSQDKNMSKEILHFADSLLVGAKDFRPPEGLGPVHSQRCYVVMLHSGNAFELAKYFKGSENISAAGSPIWSWSAKIGEFGELDPKQSLFYATQLGHSYLLISNNVQELQTVAKWLLSSNKKPKIVKELHDCGINTNEVWGYRFYRHIDEQSDQVSYAPTDATKLCFLTDTKSRMAVLRLVGSHNSTTVPKIGATGKIPPFSRYKANVWEARIPLQGNDLSTEQLFDIMVLFGFGSAI